MNNLKYFSTLSNTSRSASEVSRLEITTVLSELIRVILQGALIAEALIRALFEAYNH